MPCGVMHKRAAGRRQRAGGRRQGSSHLHRFTGCMSVNADPHLQVPGGTVTTGELVDGVVLATPNSWRSFETLVRIVRNHLDHPHELKFRELRKANPGVRDAIVAVAPCAQLLRRLGWRDEGDTFRLQ